MEQKLKITLNGKEIDLEKLFAEIRAGKMSTSSKGRFGDECFSDLIRQGVRKDGAKYRGRINVECYSPVEVDGQSIRMKRFQSILDGNVLDEEFNLVSAVQQMEVEKGLPAIMKEHLKWRDKVDPNIVVDVGLEHILDILFVSATTQIDPWLVALIADNSAGSTVIDVDTMASHAGWTEDENYSEGVRQTYTDVRSGQSVTNTAAKASFSINATTTIAGAFMTSDNTKGGTSGTLLCGGNFTGGDRSVVNGDTLNVTYTFTAADDGA